MMKQSCDRSFHPTNDEGAYAIIYAALMVVLLAIAGLVIDIGTVRADRRSDRSVADAAVVAGAENISVTAMRPQAACLAAWAMIVKNFNYSLSAPSGTCNRFADSALPGLTGNQTATDYCKQASPTMVRDEQHVGNETIIVAWPIPKDASQGFLSPSLAPGSADQPFNSDADGDATGCYRLGVALLHRENFLWGSGIGIGGTTSETHSVALNIYSDKNTDIAALNILDRTRCNTLQTSGGFITVSGVAAHPGIISVESNATDTTGGGATCKTNNDYVIGEASNANNLIKATGVGGLGNGIIQSYAASLAASSSSRAYNPADVASSRLIPQPIAFTKRFGDTPVKDIYSCNGVLNPSYPDVTDVCTNHNFLADVITDLDNASKTAPPSSAYRGAQSPYNAAAFHFLPDPLNTQGLANPATGFDSCAPGSNVSVPAGNWWIKCDSLNISHDAIFHGGTIVTNGSVEVGSGGCLVVNVGNSVTACPTSATDAGLSSTTTDSMIFMRGLDTVKHLYKVAQGQVFLPRTAVIQNRDTILDMGGGSGTLYWSPPTASDCQLAADPGACRGARFQKISLWSDTATGQSLGGQTALALDGVFFTPQSRVTFSGQSSVTQNRAQFWAWDLLLNSSQTNLTMAANPDDSIGKPVSSVLLIR